ncbi:uncharacterized protein BDR25DRAFT_6607 [Lindgomyces ingoldianus]|uniref:Uncharacterized protein n=1 Tax=Lindgomyces ingoldianus TaxID=673940 RepID=A0ACB6RI61_9PLEO|nr:uncharacterized protein BDR25DRAFT_6607 [Lindgomyces ingoldianus]KAF2478025.1 hypothetical protein BDR25DRAFT_6607 [Lindgomyces ingoldianus]
MHSWSFAATAQKQAARPLMLYLLSCNCLHEMRTWQPARNHKPPLFETERRSTSLRKIIFNSKNASIRRTFTEDPLPCIGTHNPDSTLTARPQCLKPTLHARAGIGQRGLYYLSAGELVRSDQPCISRIC